MIKFDFNGLTPQKDEIEVFSQADFDFTKVQPNTDRILEIAGKYGNIKNLILLARGGSISTFRAFWEGYGKYISDKNVYFVDTVDPDFIFYIKDKCTPKDSLVLAISKSGTTVDVLEDVFAFADFTQIVITGDSDNPLNKIAKEKNYDLIIHPDVGGRFSGLTEVSLFPAAFCGLDINEIRKGGLQAYTDYEKSINDAKKLALIVKDLSDKKYDQVFMPIYSKKLAAFTELITQLIEETAAKEGRGITILPMEAPECHHYFNQRFFGGPKNMIGFFTGVSNFEEEVKIEVPENLRETKLRNGSLGVLNGLNLPDSLKFELKGAYEDTKNNNIPTVKLEIDKIDEFNLGYFTAFLQTFAVYLARAFEVDPFNQPKVEGAKKISFEARKNYKK